MPCTQALFSRHMNRFFFSGNPLSVTTKEKNMTSTKTKIPNELFSVVRDKTFYTTANLVKPDMQSGDYPLASYGGFSRYEFCVIQDNASSQKIAASAKCKVEEILPIIRLSKKAYVLHLDSQLNDNSQDAPSSPAYTVKIFGKDFNGKTAAQYAAEHSVDEAKKAFTDQAMWLKENLAKNPKFASNNQKQIDALRDAYKLLSDGKLNLENVTSNKTIILYDGGMRPNLYKKVPNYINPNFHFVYELKIEWEIGAKSPLHIYIQNYYAPVLRNENGTLNVQKREADKQHYISNSMNLSADEWMNLIYFIESNMRNFEIINAKSNFDIVQKAISEAKNSANSTTY